MGKTKRMYDDMLRQMQSLVTQIRQPSPYETQMNSEMEGINSFLNSKDYRNLPTGVNIDMLPLSDYQRMSKMAGPGDNVAGGVLSADARRNQQELDSNKLTRDWAGAYEQKVGDLINRKYGMMDSLQGNYQNRMNSALQGTMGMGQAILNRPKGFNWGGLLSSALPGVLSMI